MKKWMFPVLASLILVASFSSQKVSAEDDSLAATEAEAEKMKDRPEWQSALKTQYKLTDEQIKTMQDKGLSYPQMAMASALADKSGKTLDVVLKMRTEDKMGWGKIAKELGVPPKEIGQSVAALHHGMRDEKRMEREAKKEAKREARQAAKDAKRAEKDAKRAEKAESHKH